jgi:hypothetical protein
MSKEEIIKKLSKTRTVLKDGRLIDNGHDITIGSGKRAVFEGMGARVHVL